MRKILFALGLLLSFAVAANAQGCGPQNPNCVVPTAQYGTSNNQAASTAFVQGAVSGLFGNVANNTVLGNVSGVSAPPAPITATQLTTLCNVFTSTLPGCVPSSGGGTTNFLRADGTWAAPGGGGAVASVANSDGTLTISPTTGSVIASLALGHANTWLAQQTNQGATTTSPGWYAQIAGDTFPRVRVGLNATDVPSVAFGPGNAARDAFIERLGAGSLRFGAPDAAAPVAQILSVQNVVAGTSNTAGANLTIAGSKGTGTGLGGSIIFQVAPAGTTGTAQNALATALTIDSTRTATFSPGPVKINTPTDSTSQGLVINGVGSQTGSLTADFAYNKITVTNDALNVSSPGIYTYGQYVELDTGGANAKGGKFGFRGLVNNYAASTVTGGDLVGVSGWGTASQPNGGTNTGAGAAGTIFGMEGVALAYSGATNYFVVAGVEFDAIIQSGASTKHRWGASISGNGTAQGAVTDAAIEIGAATAAGAFKYGILLDNIHGFAPLPTTGCVLCTDGSAVTITTGIDLSPYTISGNFLKGPGGFAVAGTGALTVAVTGSTQCLHVNTAGLVSGTGSDCGSGGGAVSTVTNSDGTLTISPTSGAVVASLALGHANTWTAAQAINLNAAALPSAIAGVALQVGAANSAVAGIQIDAFGASTSLYFRRADGTAASPTAVQANESLGAFSFRGYGTTAYATIASVAFLGFAAQNFTDTAWGGFATIETIPNGSTTRSVRVRVENDGGVLVPDTVTGGSKGAGTLNASGLYVSNVAVLTANQTITLSGDVTGSGTTAITTVLATAQPAVHTWALAQTFTTSIAVGGGSIGSDALEVTGTTTHNGGVTVAGAPFTLSGNQSVAAWTTNGVRIKGVTGTLTDTTSSGTVAAAYTDVLGGNTIAASSATTYTHYTSLYAKAAVTGTNVTFTNAWALGADSLRIGTSNQLSVTAAGVLSVNGAATFNSTAAFGSTASFTGAVTLTGGLNTPLALTQGGSAASLTASNGGIIYSTASAMAVLAGTVTSGQCLLSGSSAAPTWGSCSGGAAVSAVSNSDGTLTISPTTGAVVASLSAARKTLPTRQVFLSGSGTYTTPANVLWIELHLQGGGGGGSQSSGAGVNGAAGGDTCWRASGAACTTPLYDAGGGGAGVALNTGNGGAGGTISGSGTFDFKFPGGAGSAGSTQAAAITSQWGASGGNSCFGGAGVGQVNAAGTAAATNSGAGGGAGATASGQNGGAGGAGACGDVIINTPAATYTYVVGAGGAGGSAGTGSNGGAGAAGIIIVTEHYGT